MSGTLPGDIVVDASVWTSWLLTQDVHHLASYAWFRDHRATGGRLTAPTLLLTEVGSALARRTGNVTLAHRVVNDISQLPEVRLINLTEQLGALAARLAIDLRLRGADAVYVAVAEYLSVPLVTWDREQLTRAASRITVHTP